MTTIGPLTNYTALVKALQLAIVAPDDACKDRAVELAEAFARNLTEFDVLRAKREAVRAVAAIEEAP